MNAPRKPGNSKFFKFLLVLGLLGVVWWLWRGGWLGRIDLEWVQERQADFQAYYQAHWLQTWVVFFLGYALAVAISVPGAVWFTLLAGALFGFWIGLVMVSFASTFGATLAFLLARWLAQDWVQTRFSRRLEVINQGIRQDGPFYLLTLRLVPIFPFFLINLTMGLMPIRTWTFFWVSQLGMLPGTAAYVYAGTQLAELETASDILDPGLLLAFAILGSVPWLGKWLVWLLKTKRLYGPYEKPKRFDYDLLAIGGGSAGLVSAYITQAVGAKAALVEAHKMGGDCLNTGCVPSKSLLSAAKVVHQAKEAAKFGLKPYMMDLDFGQVMESVDARVQAVAPHDSLERYRNLGVDCFTGRARVLDPWRVEVNGEVLTSRNLVVATGAKPLVPPFEGLDQVDYLTSETLWDLRHQPKELLVVGGGPIGCEMAQAFARLGSQVNLVNRGKRLLSREDPEASEVIAQVLEREGVRLLLGCEVQGFRLDGNQQLMLGQGPEGKLEIPFDQALFALGRKPDGTGFGLEELGVDIDQRGAVTPDPYLRTKFPNILVAGDVAGTFQFTHTASHQAWYAAVNGLFRPLKKFKVDNRVIPWCTFTEPEVARVGLNETEAKAQKRAVEVTRYDLADLDRALAERSAEGYVKVITEPGKDRILGVTIVGPHAGEWIVEWVLAMKYNLGLEKILGTIHIYPTLAEANKYAAGEWKKAHQPEGALRWLKRWFAWRRG